jgi:hypothetical protein
MSQAIFLTPTSGPGSGTVTSITFNGGLTSSPDPVTTTGIATIDQTNLTVQDGTVYWDTGTKLLHTTATGTAGQILTSQGSGLPPLYADAATSGTVTSVSGGNNITITGTATINPTVNVSGTTNHSLLLGNSTGSINSLGVATNGQLPIGSTGADPVLATITAGTGISVTNGAGSITIATTGSTNPVTTLHTQDGNNVTATAGVINISGGNSLTTTGTSGPNTATISLTGITQYDVQTGGALNALHNVAPSATSGVPLISQGAASQPIFGTAVVAGGGTGAVSFTVDGVIYGNGTSALGVTAAGTTGQVLTGVTAGAPVWASPAASAITITGNTGGALGPSNAFTFTGGTTGLSFGGSGSTETLSGTLAIANGGTNATSMANTDGVVYYDGTRLVTTTVGTAGQVLTSNGAVAPTFQAAPGVGTNVFAAYLNTSVSNATGNGVTYKVVFDSVFNNPGSNYNTGTGNFTAPATGNYQFNFLVSMGNLPGGITRAIVYFVTTSATYKCYDVVPGGAPGGDLLYSFSTLTRMTSGDTANVQVRVFGGTQTINVEGSSGGSQYPSIFNGYYVSA